MPTTDKTITWNGADELRQHLRPIGELRPDPNNPHEGNVQAIAESLKRYGQVRAVLIEPNGMLKAGHHVWKAARSLGWTHVAAIPAEFESREDALGYLLADNQLANLGQDDQEQTRSILEDVKESRGTLEGTGFTDADLEDMKLYRKARTETVHYTELKAHPRNYREHPQDQIDHLMRSLAEHGFYRNVVTAKDGTILAGHGLYVAARRKGIVRIPITRLTCGPNSPEALKVLAGDNELGKLAEFNDRELTEMLGELAEGDASALLGTGYNAQSLANLLMITRPQSEVPDFDAASEWVGLPEFEPAGKRIQIVFSFEDEEGRTEFIEQLGIDPHYRMGRTWCTWWPPREREDLKQLKFIADE